MIALPNPPPPAPVHGVAIVSPGPRQASFGSVRGAVSPRTTRVVLLVDGEKASEKRTTAGREVRFTVALPARNSTLRLVAYHGPTRLGADAVGPVFGLPRAARPHGTLPTLDGALQHRLKRLAARLGGITGFYVMNLGSGKGAAWNARARFPAASTVKLAIALEVMSVRRDVPTRTSRVGRLLRKMLVDSDNKAANDLLVWLGGSQTAGAARVDAMLERIGLLDTHLFSGYILGTASTAGRPIPLQVAESPSFAGKYTSAWDLARLHRDLHLAMRGRGPLARQVDGITRADARSVMFLLCHSADHGKLDRYVRGPGVAVPHKAGWISTSRHDAGIVYWPGGAFVAAVMTWRGSGITYASDVFAGRVAQVSLERFRTLSRRAAQMGTTVS